MSIDRDTNPNLLYCKRSIIKGNRNITIIELLPDDDGQEGSTDFTFSSVYLFACSLLFVY